MKEQLEEIIKQCEGLIKKIELEEQSIDMEIDFRRISAIGQEFEFVNPINMALDDSQKKTYVRMLIILFKDIDETKLELALVNILKISHSIDVDIDIEEEYIRVHKWSKIEIGDMMDELLRLPLISKEMFVLDLLDLSSRIGLRDNNIIEESAALISSFGLNKDMMRQLFDLSKCLIEKNDKEYRNLTRKNLSIDLLSLASYLTEYQGVMASNEKLIWIRDTSEEKLFLEIATIKEGIKDEDMAKFLYEIEGIETKPERIGTLFKSDRIVLENVNTKISDNWFFECDDLIIRNSDLVVGEKELNFTGCGRIHFENCSFEKMKNTIVFKKNKTITIVECSFKGVGEKRCFDCRDVDELRIEKSTFKDFCDKAMSKDNNSKAFCGCYEIVDVKSVAFLECEFSNCNTMHYEGGYADHAIGSLWNIKNLIMKRCEFKHCKNKYWRYGSWDYSRGCLFELPTGTKIDISTCTFEDCAKANTVREKLW